jgi:hypothetical protein
MPHEVVIRAKHPGTIEAEYPVIANPKIESLTQAELEQIRTLKPVERQDRRVRSARVSRHLT